jgi:hypothetical protein
LQSLEWIIISDNSLDNVILLPKTIDFYELELTRFLQLEQYGEALELLAFLLRFPDLEANKHGQWEALQEWLETMVPQADLAPLDNGEEELESEEGLLRQAVAEKTTGSADYPDKLIYMLENGTMEQKLIAVEQLIFVDHIDVSPSIIKLLKQSELHPSIQFKALQSLKIRGEKGIVCMLRNGSEICVEIEQTPLSEDEFPPVIREMLGRLNEISEADHPDFSFFAQQAWHEFLVFAYGTPLYSQLLEQEESGIDIWASSLHAVLQQLLFGSFDQEEIMEKYAITGSMILRWKQTFKILHSFMDRMDPG